MKTTTTSQSEQDGDFTCEFVLEMAWESLRHDDIEQARETFLMAFHLSPASGEALYGQALCLRKLNRPNEARRILDVLREIDPGYTRFFLKEALLYIDKDRYDEAIEQFAEVKDKEHKDMLWQVLVLVRSQRDASVVEKLLDAALRLFPGDPGIRSEYGWLHYHYEQYNEAIEKFDQVLGDEEYEELKAKKFKSYESALQGKIASLRRKRQFKPAHDLLKDALQLLPRHYGIQSELGWLYFDQKLYEQALEVFEANYQQGENSALQWIITCLRSLRNFAETEKWIQLALQELPEDDLARIGILNEKGWLFVDRKRYAEALNAFNEVLKTNERNQFALQGKLACLRLQGHFQEAEELIEKALDWHPESTGILSERGWLFFAQSRFNEAETTFMKAISVAPHQIDLEFSRIECLPKLNRSFEAEKILEELKQRFPDDCPAIVEQLGRFYIRQKDLLRAEDQFQSLLKNDRNNVAGLGGLGAVCLLEGRYAEAIECFRKLLAIDQYNAAWYANLAWALVRDKRPINRPNNNRPNILKEVFWGLRPQSNASQSALDEAKELCERALELDSEIPEAYACLGIIAFKLGQLRFSEDYLRTAVEKDPSGGNYVGLGALYVQMGRYEEAEVMLLNALFKQDGVPARIELGNLYLRIGKINDAILEFRRAMALDPNDADPPRALSIALMEGNNLNEAETVLRKGLRCLDESKRWRLHLTCAQLLTKRGDETEYSYYYNEAFKEVKKALQLKPEEPDSYFQAGYIRAKLKDYKGARQYFRSCLSKNENHDEAESNLIHVESLIKENKERSRSSLRGSLCVGALAVSQLVLIWFFFTQGKVTETILSVLLPILLGLVVVAFLIPVLYKLKLPGLEAELRERKSDVSSGVKGEVVFSASPLTISSGPR